MTPEGIYKEVGRNIRRYRAGTHRTQAQLASQIGISRASLANIEAGRQQVLLHHLYALADALNLDSPSVLMPVPPSPMEILPTCRSLPRDLAKHSGKRCFA